MEMLVLSADYTDYCLDRSGLFARHPPAAVGPPLAVARRLLSPARCLLPPARHLSACRRVPAVRAPGPLASYGLHGPHGVPWNSYMRQGRIWNNYLGPPDPSGQLEQ